MNKFNIYNIIVWLGITLLFTSACKDNDDIEDIVGKEPYKPVPVSPISGLRLSWDHSTHTQLSTSGEYPRMIRLKDESLLLVYEENDNIYMKQSYNKGLSWSSSVILFPKSSHVGTDGDYSLTFTDLMSQPNIIQLESGELLASCAVKYHYKVDAGTSKEQIIEYPAAIKVRRITEGLTLEPIVEVYSNLGCESPSLIELPNNEIHLYFTNGTTPINLDVLSSTDLSRSYSEHKIEMIVSSDGGRTWSSKIGEFGRDGEEKRWIGAKTIAARNQKSNKRPSATIVGEEIVVALSDNKTVTYKPYTVRTLIEDNWPYAINGDTKDRDYAFYEIVPEKYSISSPYLIQLSSGETLLGYETDGDRFEGSETMEVAIGDKRAMNFQKFTQPFPFPDRSNAINNSLMQLDNSTIVALTTSNHNKKDGVAPWMIKGYLIDDLTITNSEITEFPIFVGGKSDANIRVGLGVDASNLYIKVVAIDNTRVEAEQGSQKGDGVYLYIDAANLSLLDVDEGIYKLWVSSTGDAIRWDGKEGEWIKSNPSGMEIVATTLQEGYMLDITIPTQSLPKFNKSGIRFGVGLTDYVNEKEGTTELLSLCKDLRSSSWLGVSF